MADFPSLVFTWPLHFSHEHVCSELTEPEGDQEMYLSIWAENT